MGIIFNAIGELFDIFNDTKNEIKEIIFDGTKEIIVNNNSDYKTSYDIRDEANRIIHEAEKKLSLEKECAQYKFCKAEKMQNDLLKSRERIRDMRNITTVSDSFSTELKSHLQLSRNVGAPGDSSRSSKKFVQYYSSSFCSFGIRLDNFLDTNSNDISFSHVFSTLISIKERKEAANTYLSAAKDYELKVKYACAEINTILVKLEGVYLAMFEEQYLINTLESAMNYNKSLDYKTIDTILNQLENIEVCGDSGIVSQVYKIKIEELKGKIDYEK